MCLSWLNGAMADNGWTQSRSPALMPDWCVSDRQYDLGTARDLFTAHLESRSAGQLSNPAIMLFREAMAAAYPCAADGSGRPAGAAQD